MAWEITVDKKVTLKKPVLIEGLPGIGNVGKIAIDFLIDELDCERFARISSNQMPSTVFINEDNLIEFPVLELWKGRIKGQDIIFLTGDVQPTEDLAVHDFVKTLLDFADENGCTQVITTGGIGLPEVPEDPQIYCTGTDAKKVKAFAKKADVRTDLFGVVGPIIGVTGLLVAYASSKKIEGTCVLVETLGNPAFIGIESSKLLLQALSNYFGFSVDVSSLDNDIKAIEDELVEKMTSLSTKDAQEKMRYIG